jgi:hypothetical protein
MAVAEYLQSKEHCVQRLQPAGKVSIVSSFETTSVSIDH